MWTTFGQGGARLGAAIAIGITLLAGATSAPASAQSQGVVRTASPHDAATTIARFEEALRGRGLKVFDGVDHAGAAAAFDRSMPPSRVIIFGNPAVGTGMMLQSPEAAIDFPLKALIYQDADGAVWLAFNDAEHMRAIFARHGLSEDMAWYEGLIGGLTAEALAGD